MIVLVAGGRDFTDELMLCRVMGELYHRYKFTVVVEGDAKGADRMAGNWAALFGIHVARMSALWDKFGSRAGPLRNAAMLKLRPDLVVLFPGGNGTANMKDQALKAGILVVQVGPAGDLQTLQPIARSE